MLLRIVVATASFALALSCDVAGAQGVGTQVVPNAPLPLRSAPPTPFSGKGNQVGVATPQEKYEVIERRVVPTIAGAEKWDRVRAVDNPSKGGWIYNGRDASSNVRAAR